MHSTIGMWPSANNRIRLVIAMGSGGFGYLIILVRAGDHFPALPRARSWRWEELAPLLGNTWPVPAIENEGVLVTGSDVLEAFGRPEVLKSEADAIKSASIVRVVAPLRTNNYIA